MDTLETAFSFGIHIHPETEKNVLGTPANIKQDPYEILDFKQIFKSWLPLTFAVNSLNRSMGHSDFYPFIVAPDVMAKLSFIHQQINKVNI